MNVKIQFFFSESFFKTWDNSMFELLKSKSQQITPTEMKNFDKLMDIRSKFLSVIDSSPTAYDVTIAAAMPEYEFLLDVSLFVFWFFFYFENKLSIELRKYIDRSLKRIAFLIINTILIFLICFIYVLLLTLMPLGVKTFFIQK